MTRATDTSPTERAFYAGKIAYSGNSYNFAFIEINFNIYIQLT